MKKILFMAFFILLKANANPCAMDTAKFCSAIEPGKGQIAKCLSDYQEQLSVDCAKDLKEFKKSTGSKNPCFEDLADFCSKVPSLPGRYEYCLLRNETRLSQKCSADFKNKKGKLIINDVCAQDIADNCYEAVSGPEGAIVRCLIKKQAQLSGYCQKAIAQKVTSIKKNNPCFEDTEKYCPTQTLFADIHDCMTKKLTALTQACKKVVEAEIKKERGNPCYKDLIRHCKSGLSSTQQHQCLSLNENALSQECIKFRSAENTKLKQMVQVCEEDRLKLCPSAPFRDGMIVKCLKENFVRVSADCQQLLK